MSASEPLPVALTDAPVPIPPGPALPSVLHALLVATGGAGGSWARCILPFGAVALLAGTAATAITFSLRGPRLDLAQGAALVALGAGLGLLATAFLCWRARRRREPRTPALEVTDEGQLPPLDPSGPQGLPP